MSKNKPPEDVILEEEKPKKDEQPLDVNPPPRRRKWPKRNLGEERAKREIAKREEIIKYGEYPVKNKRGKKC